MTYMFEGSEIVAPLSIISDEPDFYSETISLQPQIASQGVQRWVLEFGITHLSDNKALDSFVNAVNKRGNYIKSMVMPQLHHAKERTTLSGSVTANGATLAGSTSITVNDDGQSGILSKGYFVKFANHTKVYTVTADVDFAGTGTKSVGLYPPLVADVALNEQMLIGNSVTLEYIRDINDIRGITFFDGKLSGIDRVRIFEVP